jgi:hypothetical protein
MVVVLIALRVVPQAVGVVALIGLAVCAASTGNLQHWEVILPAIN